MPRRVPARTIRLVRKLLDDGMPKRAVARHVKVSRWTVARVARGDRRAEPAASDRCEGCGGLVRLPCRVCAVRRLLRSGKVRPASELPDAPAETDPLAVDLRGERRRRYEALRREKQAAGEPPRDGPAHPETVYREEAEPCEP